MHSRIQRTQITGLHGLDGRLMGVLFAMKAATPLIGWGCDPTNHISEDAMRQLDRARQRALLEQAAEAYPDAARLGGSPPLPHPDTIAADLHYLIENRLLKESDESNWDWQSYRITAKGIDFLSEDGGLSAVLGVVTVRFEAETMRALLLARAEADGGDPSVREQIVAQLRSLPAAAIQQVSQQVVAEAIRQMPNAMQWLRTALGSQ